MSLGGGLTDDVSNQVFPKDPHHSLCNLGSIRHPCKFSMQHAFRSTYRRPCSCMQRGPRCRTYHTCTVGQFEDL